MPTAIRNSFGVTFTAEYETRGGVVYWVPKGNPAPLDACQEYNIPHDVTKQSAALKKYTDRVVRDYRAARRNHVPSDEEMFEMRAAFGAGTTVVDVLTGKKVRV